MDNFEYKPYADRAMELLSTSIKAHHDDIFRKGVLGNDPSQQIIRAGIFEIGCLHLYVLDHELRRGHKEDGFLNELWAWLGQWLLGLLPSLVGSQEHHLLLGWRLGRYTDVVANIEANETYGEENESIRQEDYFYNLAEQFVFCLNADASCKDESGIYPGIVEESGFSELTDLHKRHSVNRLMTDLLFENLLPLHTIATLWAQDRPFYDKPLPHLDTLVAEGTQQARMRFEERTQERFDFFCSGRWQKYHDDARQFVLALAPPRFDNEPWNQRLPVEHNSDGYPYLRVTLADVSEENKQTECPEAAAEDGKYPLRILLGLAHDIGYGLITSDFRRSTDDEPDDVPLSLGKVISLLRTGSLLSSYGENANLSNLDALQIMRPTPWQVSTTVIVSLVKFYQSSDETIRSKLSEYNGPQFGWVTDSTGAGALIVAPANERLLSYLIWMLPPGSMVAGELDPQLAKYPLVLEDKVNDLKGTELPYSGATVEGRAVALAENSRFVRAEQVTYGSAGEPYEVVIQCDAESNDEDSGSPLLVFALPCYELGRGIALKSCDGAIIWRISLGDVIGLLRDGVIPKISPPHSENRNDSETQPSVFDPKMFAAIAPDRITLPVVTERGIRWVLNRAGVASPQMGLTWSDTGKCFLFLGPPPDSPEIRNWAKWRISWYLPSSTQVFALTAHSDLIPYPI